MKKILLVEDDPFLVDIYKTKFKDEGFEVEVAQEGKQALAKIEEQNPDVLLLDLVLPHLDGFELLREIRNNEKMKDLKVIILSNLSQKGEVEKGLSMGATKYLIKAHYTPSEVVKEIKQIFKE